jgi:phage-related protein
LPAVEVFYFQEDDDKVPLIHWLDRLPAKAQQKCQVRLERLEAMGNDLRRPEADYLRDDIYELRASCQGVNYRMLYFFHGGAAVVVSHGIVKEQRVPPREIALAVKRRQTFESRPEKHAFKRK